jgi:hypothetical protein
MNGDASALDLFGTDEPIADRRSLTAGPLTAILEDGNLRTIRFAGIEVVRAINYLARDASWGTYRAELSNVQITERNATFEVAYDGLCAGPQGSFSYRMTITGNASGMLTLEAEGVALSDFPTNRTGFVVLHPSEAAGGRLTIRHSDDRVEETVFPKAISPDQPAFDIAALTHEPTPGMTCSVAMEGDAFEMEDQRNWTDASFKTYVRPLSKPRPYVITEGARDSQRITVSVNALAAAVEARYAAKATLRLGAPAGRMPSMALFLDPDDLPAALAAASSLGVAQDVILRFDLSRSHDRETLRNAAGFAASIDARLVVEAIFDAADPDAEAKFVSEAILSSGVEPDAVLISPRREFKTRPSNTLPAGQAPIGELARSLKQQGISALIGAGTPSFFTEFNRNPPVGDADFVFFSTAAIVHAADDLSVMETLGVFPDVIETARENCPGKPIWLGPCTIGIRHNPYGADIAPNPKHMRVPGARDDPRHGALFGAAFAVGIASQAAANGIDCLTIASPTGSFGLLDELGNRRPIQAVHAALARAAGAERYEIAVGHHDIAAIAYRLTEHVHILLANLGAEDIDISIPPNMELVAFDGEVARASTVRSTQLGLPPYRTTQLVFSYAIED